MQQATLELIWLNEREEAEVSRDWTARNLNMADIQEHYEVSISMDCISVTHVLLGCNMRVLLVAWCESV